MKLSVFRGGFTREAAEAVAGASVRLLLVLVNKLLIQRSAESGRYTIHELMRQYAEEKLKSAGELDAIQDTHSQHLLQWLIQQRADLTGSGQTQEAQKIMTDFDNIQAAWEFG